MISSLNCFLTSRQLVIMFEQAVLGIIQGIAEWLPVSSSGVIALVKKSFFHSTLGLEELSEEILFLHLGTFLAALCYFHKKVFALIKSLCRFPKAPEEDRKVILFLTLSTIISGGIGLTLIKTLAAVEDSMDVTGKSITLLIGLCLLGTAYLELRSKKGGQKTAADLTLTDSILLGIAQGLAALPGFSRSGLTVASLLLRKFNKTDALQLSFLMSLPIVLAGNILLNIDQLAFTGPALIGLAFSFLFGLITIHALLKIAERVNFGYFVLIFAILTIISVIF